MNFDSLAALIQGSLGALGVMSIFFTLFLAGRIHTDSEFKRLERRCDRLEETISDKDKTIAAANERADVAVKASALVADAFASGGTSPPRQPRRYRGGQ